MSFKKTDIKLINSLRRLTESQKNYWEFRHDSTRTKLQACSQYPAMMIPQMQHQILNTLVNTLPSSKAIYEPFVGSGTVMLEAMNLGLDFVGHDINPLAILLCKAKIGPFKDEELKRKIEKVIINISLDRKWRIESNLQNLSKWFDSNVAQELSKIRRAVRLENSLWVRRFFWMTLAETVRLTCNSRTSTYKLHIRSKEDLLNRKISPISLFVKLLHRNLSNFREHKLELQEKKLLVNYKYKGCVNIGLKRYLVSF